MMTNYLDREYQEAMESGSYQLCLIAFSPLICDSSFLMAFVLKFGLRVIGH